MKNTTLLWTQIFVIELTCSHLCQGVFLCQLFNICDNNSGRSFEYNVNIAFPDEQDRDIWVESWDLSNNQVYHFGKDAPAMDWWQANMYCANKGAFLVEPATREESQFIRQEAGKISRNINWWIGLREVEPCSCKSMWNTYPRIDHGIVGNLGKWEDDDDLIRIHCRIGFTKVYEGDQREWMWTNSWRKLTFADWNWRSKEPNGKYEEHCVTMWHKATDLLWADFPCSQKTDSNNDFKPICQKEKKYVHHDAKCIEYNVNYYLKDDESNVITKIKHLPSFHGCQSNCRSMEGCSIWSWDSNSIDKNCCLMSGIAKKGFRQTKIGIVSGVLQNGCSNRNWMHARNDDINMPRLFPLQ